MYLIIGASGLLGKQISLLFTKNNSNWIGTFNKRQKPGLLPLDITESARVQDFFLKIKPSYVFLCANLTGGVDFCEKNPEIGKRFYIEGTKLVGKNCLNCGSTLVFISTDYVFDGAGGPYRENDNKSPLNIYGRLKLEAEEWIQANLKKYIIIRTTNVYGWDPQTITPNYMMQLYRSLERKAPFNAASFLWGNPTYAPDLARAAIELAENNAAGIFHVVGKTFINRYDWAIKACKVFNMDSSLIKEIKEPSSNMIPRPLKSNLDTKKFISMYTTELHDLDHGLELMKNEI